MELTPQQDIIRSVVTLVCLVCGIILFTRSFFPIPDIINIMIVVAAIYIYSMMFEPHLSQTMLPELIIIIISVLIFRIDELVLQSSLTDLLTKITSIIVVNILFAWEILIFMISVIFSAIVCKKRRRISDNKQIKLLYIGIPFIILITVLLANISQISFTVVDPMSLLFDRSQDIVRIDIIRECSGVYGLMIFTCSFLLFGIETKRKINWNKKKTIGYFSLGFIGVYLTNLLRIIALINASLYTDPVIKSIIHTYLGSILILLFIISYWGVIWRNSFGSIEQNHSLSNN